MPQPAILIRLRPRGPWRFGPGNGGSDRVDALYRSDRLYSAVTHAMQQLGKLDAWLDATARARTSSVAFTSLFPFQGDTFFAIPPSTLWPPPAGSLTASSPVFLSKIRWDAARFVPVSAIETILMGQTLLADQWLPDPESECLLRRDRPSASPFRTGARSMAAVDRPSGACVSVHTHACIEFEAGAGLWTVVRFADAATESAWAHPIESAFRLLADTGFGGRRSIGWGQTEAPEMQRGSWPALLLPRLARASRHNGATANAAQDESQLYWVLSLYSPAASDSVDWSGGDYRLTVRGGRVQAAGAGSGAEKKRVQMVTEGSVLASRNEPSGLAVDVAPEGFAHPVYRSGIAVALRLPVIEAPSEQGPVEEPGPEAVESETPSQAVPENVPEPAGETPAEPSTPEPENLPQPYEEDVAKVTTEEIIPPPSEELPSSVTDDTAPEHDAAPEQKTPAPEEETGNEI